MTYHSYYDQPEWPYWNDLHKAQNFIIDYVYKKSWCRLCCKEKYGTIRYEYVLPPGSHGKWLRRLRIKCPLWRKKIVINGKVEYFTRWLLFWDTSWLYYKWRNYGGKKLKEAVELACIKWPHIKEEIKGDLYD